MINIGIDLPASVLGASSANVWHIPVDTNNDSFGPLERYFKDPLREGVDVPAFITFPSLKVRLVYVSRWYLVDCVIIMII